MSPIIIRPAPGRLRDCSKVLRPAAGATSVSTRDRQTAATRRLCGRSADRAFLLRHSDGDLIAQAAHAPDAGGIGLDRARKSRGAASRSRHERDQQSGMRFSVRSAPNIEMAHDLIAKPLTLWRIMRKE